MTEDGLSRLSDWHFGLQRACEVHSPLSQTYLLVRSSHLRRLEPIENICPEPRNVNIPRPSGQLPYPRDNSIRIQNTLRRAKLSLRPKNSLVPLQRRKHKEPAMTLHDNPRYKSQLAQNIVRFLFSQYFLVCCQGLCCKANDGAEESPLRSMPDSHLELRSVEFFARTLSLDAQNYRGQLEGREVGVVYGEGWCSAAEGLEGVGIGGLEVEAEVDHFGCRGVGYEATVRTGGGARKQLAKCLMLLESGRFTR